MAEVLVSQGPDAGKRAALPAGEALVVGRGSAAGLQLNDDQVSRAHCSVAGGPSGYVLSDLESRNGTFLNGRKISGTTALRPGDAVQIGNTVFSVLGAEASLGGTPPEPAGSWICLSCGVRALHPCRRCGAAFAVPDDAAEGLRIVDRLGAGGMGVVFKAEKVPGGEPVAMKVFAFVGEPRREGLKRFFREARIPSSLAHANVVQVLGTGALQGRPPAGALAPGQNPCKAAYIVLEYVDGDDLYRVVGDQGPLPLARALGVACTVAGVLEAAAAKGIVHRDIKPQNLMLAADGTVKVMDFGLSKSFEDAGLSGVTKTGLALGTPHFMAPEQVRDARSADHRADLYSLGATLYFLLTGRLPFSGKRIREVLTQVLEEAPPPLRALLPDAPQALEDALRRALEKNPDKRQPSAGAFRAELEAVLRTL